MTIRPAKQGTAGEALPVNEQPPQARSETDGSESGTAPTQQAELSSQRKKKAFNPITVKGATRAKPKQAASGMGPDSGPSPDFRIDPVKLAAAIRETEEHDQIVSKGKGKGAIANPALSSAERRSLLKSLAAGEKPADIRIHVGRKAEFTSLASDVDGLAQGYGTFRFVVGESGIGKTELRDEVEHYALGVNVVAATVRMVPRFRLHGGEGAAMDLYREIVSALRVPGGDPVGGLDHLLDSFSRKIRSSSGQEDEDTKALVRKLCRPLLSMTGGYTFVRVLEAYTLADEKGDEAGELAALRWLRGEFDSVREARAELGVQSIISDEQLFETVRLVAGLCRLAGFSGLHVWLDEMSMLTHSLDDKSRNANFGVLLSLYNDVHQRKTRDLNLILAGMPDFLWAPRRGLSNYESFKTRLGPEQSAPTGSNIAGPVITLIGLSNEDSFLLLQRIRSLCANGSAANGGLPDDALLTILARARQLSAEQFMRPRDFTRPLARLILQSDQEPNKRWTELLETAFDPAAGSGDAGLDGLSL